MRVALVSEGTYPFAMGGVSVWCDQLIRGLPDYRWEMVALTVDGAERQVWPSPPNLDRIRSIPLWLPRPPRGGNPGPTFLGPYAQFLAALLAPTGSGDDDEPAAARRRFLRALRGLYEYAADGADLGGALLSEPALTAMVDAWRAGRPGGAGGAEPLTLADACDAAWLIGHMLRPLAAEPVVADVVHCAMNGLPMLVGMAAKWRHGTPLVLSEHGIYLRERYLAYLDGEVRHPVRVLVLGFFRQLAGAAYLIADALAPHSSYNRRWQLRNGADPARMWTMYNGVAPEEFTPATGEPPEPTIAFMGRVDPLKDLHTLIQAFALVRQRVPTARLRMFGDTPAGNEPYRDSCLRLIGELGLTGVAVLEGRVDTPVDAYHAGSIVALTSISEGFPYTVVEAMACGRTVVCTNVGGVAEAVADTGLVVPPRDVAAVADACVALLTDDGRRARLGGLARERVLANFTLRQALDAYRAVYDRVAGRASGACPDKAVPSPTESVAAGPTPDPGVGPAAPVTAAPGSAAPVTAAPGSAAPGSAAPVTAAPGSAAPVTAAAQRPDRAVSVPAPRTRPRAAAGSRA